MNKRTATAIAKGSSGLHRGLLAFRLGRADGFSKCQFSQDRRDPYVHHCHRCGRSIRLSEPQQTAARSGLNRDCHVRGWGDWVAVLATRLGYRKTPECKCDQRQAFLNHLGFFVCRPKDAVGFAVYRAGMRFGLFLREIAWQK